MEYLIYLILAPIAAVFLAFTAINIWKYRIEPQGLVLLIYMIMVSCFLAANIAELLIPIEKWILRIAKLEHLFFSLLSVSLFVFALIYSGNKTLAYPSRIWPLLIIPVITVIVLITNEQHGLMYKSVDYFSVSGLRTMDADYGIWFWISGAYRYALLIIGVFILIRVYITSHKIFRYQTLWIAGGALLPLLFNLIYVFRIFPFIRKDFTPLAFAMAGGAFFIGVFKYRLLHIVPIARNTVLEEMDSGVIILDEEQNVIDFNPAAAKVFSFNETNIGLSVWENEKAEKMLTGLDLSKKGDISRISQGAQKKFGANGKYFDIRIRLLEKNTSAHMGVLIVVEDVTERVKLIQSKTEAVNTLEHRNRELQEMQVQLIHQEKLASIGQLAAGIAHEINNPLSFVKSNISALHNFLSKESKNEGMYEDIILDVQKGLERIKKIVKDMLSFSRPRIENTITYCDVRRCLDNVLEICHNEYKYYAHIIKEYNEVPNIECRAEELNLVFLNIITNAAQAIAESDNMKKSAEKSGFSNKGTLSGPYIRIRTKKEGASVVVEVVNNGPPIKKEVLPNIFEPFYTTKIGGEGIGLGLSIAWNIVVKRHGGMINCESRQDETIFRIILPITFHRRQIEK